MSRVANIIHSIRTKLCILVALAVLITGVLVVWTYSPNVKKEILSMAQHYLADLSVSYGMMVEDEIESLGADKALTSDNLSKHLAGVGLEGIESSYVYVVSSDGTMLYHPTADKIGQPVENEVVKGVTADLQAGKKVENKVVNYEFKGVTKYASYYVNDNADYILVVTTDEEELLTPLNSINSQGRKGILIALVVCILFDMPFITIAFIRPIFKLKDLTLKVAAMDFTENEEQEKLNKRKDEIGLIAQALASLKQELVNVVTTIRDHSDTLSVSSEALHTGATDTNATMEQVECAVNDIAQGATSQAEETQRATENVVTMGNMIQETTKKVEELMNSAEHMRIANQNAKQILTQLSEINERSEEYIDVIANQTDVTNESALKIGEATKIITEIAEETNLLSLNASIEAARAGEQGRGFAVVASEIQKLAEQSTESAKKIEDIITMLLADSEKAVETMGQVKDIMREQSKYMERTDEAFIQIEKDVEQSVAGMNVISAKTQELDEARINVVDIVNNLTAIAEENAASTQETSASVVEVASIVTGISEKAEDLNAIAQEMDEKVSIFKL